MWPDPQETAHLVTFTEEILNRKLHISCSVRYMNILRSHRFTIHQHRRKMTFIENAIITAYNTHFRKTSNVPQRPLSCGYHLRTSAKVCFHWFYLPCNVRCVYYLELDYCFQQYARSSTCLTHFLWENQF